MQKATAELRKSTNEYAKLADESREKLKEIGDVQNWAEMIERELLVLEDCMDRVERGEDLEQGEGEEEGKGKKKGWLGWF